MMRRLLCVLLLAAACHSAAPSVDDRLFFGRNIPAGGTVSEGQWDTFVREVVMPRFPKGLTIYAAKGEWNGGREDVYVVEILHSRGEDETALGEIAAEYKRRFGQEAVLRVTAPSKLRFY
jgi:Protein of unknown function (DUF3574)